MRIQIHVCMWTCRWCLTDSEGITKVIRIHYLETMWVQNVKVHQQLLRCFSLEQSDGPANVGIHRERQKDQWTCVGMTIGTFWRWLEQKEMGGILPMEDWRQITSENKQTNCSRSLEILAHSALYFSGHFHPLEIHFGHCLVYIYICSSIFSISVSNLVLLCFLFYFLLML